MKVCPSVDKDAFSEPHTHASLANVQTRLRRDCEGRLQYASPSKDIFCRTAAYLTAIRKLGCSRPLSEATECSSDEEERKKMMEIYWTQVRRGYWPKETPCEGRLLFLYDSHGRARMQ